MKRFVLAASAAAIFAVAGAGSANAAVTWATSAKVDINASVDSKCGITAQSSSVQLGDLTGSDAKVLSTVTDDIAKGLNSANIIAFCNNGGSKVKVERAVLAREGASGNTLLGEYAQYVRYNLDASINGLALDSTSTDDASVVAQRFGGHDSSGDGNTHVKFVKAASNGTAVATSGGATAVDNKWNSLTDRRLAAGQYTGYVTIELTPAG